MILFIVDIKLSVYKSENIQFLNMNTLNFHQGK